MSDRNHYTSEKYAYLNRLNTSELENLLRSELDSPENRDADRTLYILSLLAERDPESAAAREAETERAWQEFLTQYETSEGAGQTLYPIAEAAEEKPRAKRRPLHRFSLIAAVVACLIAALAPAALGGDGLVKKIGQWSDEQFYFIRTYSENDGWAEIQELLIQDGIESQVLPSYLPAGFQSIGTEVTRKEHLGFVEYNTAFKSEDGFISFSVTKLTKMRERLYEKDDTKPEICTKNGIDHYFFTNRDSVVVAWNNGDLECSIHGTISMSELKRIVESIYE